MAGTSAARASAAWVGRLYPEAGEGIVLFRSARDQRPSGGGHPVDPGEAQRVATRRARTKVRRYCAANVLNRLGTLTYAGSGCHDHRALRSDVNAFFRELRRGLDVQRLPYLWTAEWHPSGHGLHVHFGVSRYIARGHIERAWPHGFVHIKLLGDLPYSSSRLQEARHAARYLSKYAAKSLDGATAGQHRYEVAQGFAPAVEIFRGRSAWEVVGALSGRMGRTPEYSTSSTDWDDYHGPPGVFASWD
jgi:hypothetical protein